MPHYYMRIYNARPKQDGGAIDPVKQNVRGGAVDFEFDGNEVNPGTWADNAIDAMASHPVFCKWDIPLQTLTDGAADLTDSAEGAFSKRIGKTVYGYAVGYGADLAAAKAAIQYKDFE